MKLSTIQSLSTLFVAHLVHATPRETYADYTDDLLDEEQYIPSRPFHINETFHHVDFSKFKNITVVQAAQKAVNKTIKYVGRHPIKAGGVLAVATAAMIESGRRYRNYKKSTGPSIEKLEAILSERTDIVCIDDEMDKYHLYSRKQLKEFEELVRYKDLVFQQDPYIEYQTAVNIARLFRLARSIGGRNSNYLLAAALQQYDRGNEIRKSNIVEQSRMLEAVLASGLNHEKSFVGTTILPYSRMYLICEERGSMKEHNEQGPNILFVIKLLKDDDLLERLEKFQLQLQWDRGYENDWKLEEKLQVSIFSADEPFAADGIVGEGVTWIVIHRATKHGLNMPGGPISKYFNPLPLPALVAARRIICTITAIELVDVNMAPTSTQMTVKCSP